jgi:tetratricopeptide (TPR) repeat protein
MAIRMEKEQDQRLSGWKAIGTFLGKEERTVRRWEAQRGLPVHRVPGGGSSSVWADPVELRAWLGAVPEENAQGRDEPATAAPPSRRRWWLIGGAAASLAAILLLFQPASSRLAALFGPPPAYGADEVANIRYAMATLAMERRTVPGLLRAEQGFAQLTRSHPGNAAGFVGLAETNLLLREFNSLPPETAFRRAAIAADRALVLDPQSARAMRVRAFVHYWSEGERATGLRMMERAITLAPDDAAAHHWYGTMLMGEGPPRAALAALDRAFRLNPDSSAIAADRAYGLYLAGEHDAAKTVLNELVAIDPEFSNTYAYLERIYLLEADDRAYLEMAERTARLRLQNDRLATVAAALAAFERGGRQTMLASLIAAEEQRFAQDGESAMRLAILHVAAGDRAAVLRWLRQAQEASEPGSEALGAFIEFAPLARDPAFRALF